MIRADPTLSAAVSTVDNVDTAAGQISTVLALGSEGEGTSGKYGIGEDTQPVPPVPAPDAVTAARNARLAVAGAVGRPRRPRRCRRADRRARPARRGGG